MHKSHQKKPREITSHLIHIVFKIIAYYPRLKGLIISRSWRGWSRSSTIESKTSSVGARSREGLEDKEGL